jgi:ABC-type amino acid transport substrate-binding protein
MTTLARILTIAAWVTLSAVAAPMHARAADDLLQTIKGRGTMRICDVDYAPWNVKNPATNQWEGVNVDLLNLVAGMLKVKLEHVDATSQGQVFISLRPEQSSLPSRARSQPTASPYSFHLTLPRERPKILTSPARRSW